MKILRLSILITLVATGSVIPVIPFALTIGQIDTFEDGATQGWHVPGPSPVPPVNEPNGGPAGAGDAFLRVTATGGNGPGSKLSVMNASQWTGNYLASGITSIRMDV